MGKLTYVNRKIAGVKLAQSIQRDIQKRIPKIGEEKKLAAVQRDPVVELDATGRQLGEDGIAIVCDALYELAETGLSRIEELNFSGNELTASSLRHLRRAVSVCPDLRDLDISNNNISLDTVEDLENWVGFLESFVNLKCVRRLEISHNPLGDFAVEAFFQVYALEHPIFIPYDFGNARKSNAVDELTDVNYSVEGFDIRSSGGHLYLAPHNTQASDLDNIAESSRKASIGTIGSSHLSSSPPSSLDAPRDPADIHGLRGIPYVVMSNIGATDLSAMWMSYVIPEHPLPSDLHPHLPPLKEGPFAATLRKYDSLTSCRGIVMTENPLVTALGLTVLKEAEERRDEDAATIEELMTNGQGRRRSSVVSDTGCDEGRRENRRNSIQDRDDSFSASSFPSKSRKALNDSRYSLDRSRARIQLNVLKAQGVKASLLWKRVMRLVVVSRAILVDYAGPIVIDGYEPTLKIEPKNSQRTSVDSTFKLENSPAVSPAAKESINAKLKGLKLDPKLSESKLYQDPQLPGKLPADIWMKIIVQAEDNDGVTSRNQRLNIFHWSRSRVSLATGLEHLSEATETQIRRVIGKVKGLTYEL
ncbi:hypothetical protein TWF225_004527 [Orbilia oligospora]|uniref:Uncharacterized protein n=1 Tax=Orbilia oligospora TaxID=2813651 RepID=A0A7C8PLE0_ORBOL|nr:hypothetical protein TWF751_005618 [Orbilia oligospora]KAF3186915.1 hypothetical protein TWF225_004527 [Orbilia oligospora]KAF3244852.1 hypothetical protein TWF128_009571 [Orbilia oligospora]KAF3250130.1 hypothetical protein TWF217_008608 [Orbilia oligospora]KAF3292923.1 hypothetical protein TWF132_005277 [Orbilia oligospora]